MSIGIILAIVWIHFVADFLLQNDKMAHSKSSSNKWLAIHVGIYSSCFIVFGSVAYVLVNFVLHFMTDYVSSRLTTKLYRANKNHWFFVVIGADQALHLTALFTTYLWLLA